MFRAASSAVRIVLVSLAWLGTIEVAGAAAATDAKDAGSINFTLGFKNLAGEWNLNPPPTDELGNRLPSDRTYYPSLGIEGAWGRKDWPVQIAFDVLNSADDGIIHVPQFFSQPAYDLRLKAHILEVGLGARRSFDLKIVNPYIGAGGLWARANAEIEVNDPYRGQFGTRIGYGHARSSSLGYWIGGGLMRRLGPRFQMGLGYRFSKATLDATPVTVESGTLPAEASVLPASDAGGKILTLVVGWSFPSH